ncbi:MAG: hypothetical protein KDC95_22970 [Planctomycetes bacterium]|nr:hypothetical protein [Planctomycetota bacterium]
MFVEVGPKIRPEPSVDLFGGFSKTRIRHVLELEKDNFVTILLDPFIEVAVLPGQKSPHRITRIVDGDHVRGNGINRVANHDYSRDLPLHCMLHVGDDV